MASSSSPQKIILESNDGESFEVDKAVALKSQTIKHLMDDSSGHDKFPLHNVNSNILTKVIEYCKKHVEASTHEASTSTGQSSSAAETNDELKTWDAEFIDVDKAILFDLMLAANYLNIKGLLDLSCKTIADMMKGKTPEQIREIFNIKNDYTSEEEEEVRRENFWAFR